MNYVYKATILKVIDGDTFDAEVDLGFNVFTKIRFRLYGVDTPEIHSSNLQLRTLANVAKNHLMDRCLNREVSIHSYKSDKYGRWLADVYINEVCLNEELIDMGMAKPYSGVGTTSSLWTD